MQKRKIWQKIEKYLQDERTVVITGSRRVGKTTTLKWALEKIDSDNIQYFDLENVANRDIFQIKDYDTIINEFENRGLDTSRRMYVAIDEIQYVPNIPSIVKYLQDHYKIKFFLSGSSSYYLKNLFSESLAGRKIIFELFPLTFSEFLRFQGVNYSLEASLNDKKNIFNKHAFEKLKSYYEEYIDFGGLPQVALAGTRQEKLSLLEDAYSSYINLDVLSLSGFKNLKSFRKLVKLLAARVGSKINTSELASILGVSRVTIENYIEFMSQTYLIRPISVYSDSADVISRKQEKIYFVDNGILNVNADLSSGAKFENVVNMQLAYKKHVSYYENDRNREVDFIVEDGTGHYALEVKETPDKSDLDVLRKRARDIGIQDVLLVGNREHAGFDNYLWGGELG
jgi:hypothetical protein